MMLHVRHRCGQRGGERRGVALVTALFAIAVLASVTAVASSAARRSAAVVNNRRSQVAARAMAESGVIAARTRIESLLREAIADSAATDAVFASISATSTGDAFVRDSLIDGVFAVAVVDVSARLDVNSAGVDGLARLLSSVAPPDEARRVAELIEARVRGEGVEVDAAARARMDRDSVAAVLLGRSAAPRVMRPFRSLDELLEVPGMRVEWLNALADDLTVDGDGRTNRRAASRQVLAAATGALIDRPSRLLLVSRGWRSGQPLTREIQAVFDVNGAELRLVRWREQDR